MGINSTGALILPESTLKYMAEEKTKRDNADKYGKGIKSQHH